MQGDFLEMSLENPLQNIALKSLNGVIIFALDTQYRYTTFTDSHRDVMKRIWGADIALGGNMLEYIQREDDRNKARANFDRALQGENFILEEEYGDETGHARFWWENRYAPILDSKGSIAGITVFVLDVTRRKEIENALRTSEINYRSIMDQAADGIFITDGAGKYLDVNRAGCQMLGLSREEISVLSVQDLVVNNTRPLRFEELLEGRSIISEREIKRKDGSLILVESSVKLIEDGRVVGIVRNITERLEQEAQMRYLAFVMNKISSAVISTDVNLRITHWNKGAESLYGWLAEEVAGRHIDEVCGTEFAPGEQEAAQKLFLQEKIWRAELKQYHRDGREVWVDASLTLLEDENQNIVGGVTINHDITERKLADEELRRTKQSIEEINLSLQHAFEREQLTSRTDELTGVFNRRFFFEILEYEYMASLRYERQLALVMFDVDDLKQTNDTYGHQAGDELLKQTAQIFRAHLRESDVFARYGGDEFVILVPSSNEQEALALMERVHRGLKNAHIQMGAQNVEITISVGIATLQPNIENADQLVSCADRALYSAKRNGKNCIVVYNAAEDQE